MICLFFKKLDGQREVGWLEDNRYGKMRMEVIDFEPNTHLNDPSDIKQKESDESKQYCTFGMKTKWSPLLTFSENDHFISLLHCDCDYLLIMFIIFHMNLGIVNT